MNITTSEIKYLMMMEKKGLHNVTEIAESLGISKPSVSVMVKKMITKDILKKNTLYRQERQPQNIRTAGSTFKNPQQNAAWKLIKESGACNLKVGGASFSEKHCNFLVNDGTATAEDLEKLGENARKLVFQKFGVNLEWEVKVVGRENGRNGK